MHTQPQSSNVMLSNPNVMSVNNTWPNSDSKKKTNKDRGKMEKLENNNHNIIIIHCIYNALFSHLKHHCEVK